MSNDHLRLQPGIGRPGAHRRADLKRLQEHALPVPLLIRDSGRDYVAVEIGTERELARGRHEVVFAYISGWVDARSRDARARGER